MTSLRRYSKHRRRINVVSFLARRGQCDVFPNDNDVWRQCSTPRRQGTHVKGPGPSSLYCNARSRAPRPRKARSECAAFPAREDGVPALAPASVRRRASQSRSHQGRLTHSRRHGKPSNSPAHMGGVTAPTGPRRLTLPPPLVRRTPRSAAKRRPVSCRAASGSSLGFVDTSISTRLAVRIQPETGTRAKSASSCSCSTECNS